MSVIVVENLIGGKLTGTVRGETLPSINPATGEVLANVPDSTSEDVALAVNAAGEAQRVWGRMPASDRSRCLERLADLLEPRLDDLALLETNDTGKPLALSRQVDMPRVVANLRFFAAMGRSFSSQSHPASGVLNYTLRQPRGVVGCISPWNLPLYLFTWKIAPALVAGNCVLAKPSELTPLTAFEVSRLSLEAGFPPGVLNVLHGRGISSGQAIVDHPAVRAISFTGGSATGKHLAICCAEQLKPISLELGGKNPTVIFADCDYEDAVEQTVRSSFSNQGQICLCGSRILVERSLLERFRDDFVARASNLVVGDPLDARTHLGAVISAAHQRKILDYIALAEAEGGRILCGGTSPAIGGRCANGFFVAPTVIDRLGPECRVNREEIFGPVVTIQPFESQAEAIALANDSAYGLAATVWTQNARRVHHMAEAIEAGVLWVNCWLLRDLRTPFGGMKQSGHGREGGEEALRFFTETKNVCVKY